MIDREKIIHDMSKINVMPNEKGVIEAFGVLITQIPTSFWNDFAERLTNKVNDDMIEAVEGLLVNAAHECGYHTGYGIITSDEWNAIVKPMIEKEPEDILYGAFAVFTAWGWADTEIIELIPGEKLIIRAYDYYEADIARFGTYDKLAAYMIRGVSGAFMDLAYGGEYDPSGKTGIFTFSCKQTKGIECGNSYGEFIVTKNT